ncbi:hypothetical protein F5B20DRAFT_247511 [Whalleya microplaca]|nr:hypothetical protein F5B20DRAFT_247511 [Whalleya microplaca]
MPQHCVPILLHDEAIIYTMLKCDFDASPKTVYVKATPATLSTKSLPATTSTRSSQMYSTSEQSTFSFPTSLTSLQSTITLNETDRIMPTTSATNTDAEGGGLSNVAVAGIIGTISAVCVFIILAFTVFWCLRKNYCLRRKTPRPRQSRE